MRIVLAEDDEPTLGWMYAEFSRNFREATIQTFRTESELANSISGWVKYPPALIVIDLMLRWSDQPGARIPRNHDPYRAGLRCHELVLSSPRLRNTPTIFYTALEDQVLKKKLQRRSHVVVVTKQEGDPRQLLNVARGLLAANMKISPVPFSSVSSEQRHAVFVILSFDKEMPDVFGAIKRATGRTRKNLHAVMANTNAGSYPLPDHIEKSIREARLVICDLTGARPNVYYELGFARALGKPILCIAKKGEQLHFDVSHLKTIFYDTFEELVDVLRRDMILLLQVS